MAYNSEGIQHIALETDNLISSWDKLIVRGFKFMKPPPGTHNEMLEERLPGHGESLNELQPRGILLDFATGNRPPRLLLKFFLEPDWTRLF